MQIDDEVAQCLDGLALEQVIAAHHDEDVVLARGKALGDCLVVVEFRGVGAEQLGERIVDPELGDAEQRRHGDRGKDGGDDDGITEGEKAEPLDAEA